MNADDSHMKNAPHRRLSGPEKVGALLLALGRSRAASLLKKFEPEELNIVLRSAEAMPAITATELAAIVADFETCLGTGVPFLGRPDDVKQLVTNAISESRLTADANTGVATLEGFWTRLEALNSDTLVVFLRKQHPQIIAYVLRRIGSDRSAALMRNLSPAERNEVVGRMLCLRDVPEAAAEALEASIQAELFESDASASAQRMTMAGILSNLDHAQSSEVLDHLAGYRPRDAEAIKKLIFKFEDLDKLPPKVLASIVDGVPVERIVIALQGMSENLTNAVLATLSPRARRMAEAELSNGTSASAADLAASRRAIVDAVLKQVAEGALELNENSAAK
jgi:flagellar motor switch protein FliG